MTLNLLACGSNSASHLALNHNQDVTYLTPTSIHPSTSIPSSSRVLDLVSTSAHSLLLLSSGEDQRPGRNILLGAGTNTYGHLGPRCALWDDVKPEGRWKEVDLLNSLGLDGDWEPVKIAATWSTSVIVYQKLRGKEKHADGGSSNTKTPSATRQEGSGSSEQLVVSCGSNDFGELGTTQPVTLDAPNPIPVSQASQRPTIVDLGLRNGETVEMIKGGQRHVVAVIAGLDKQRVIGWGASRKGELDISSLGISKTSSSAKSKGKGKVTTYPPTSPPTAINVLIPEGVGIVDIALGASHTLALLSNGRVFGWGSNAKGQLTDIDHLENVKGIAATWGGSYFLTSTGEILSQGSNTHLQLLRESSISSGTPRGQVEVSEGMEVDRIVAGSEHLLVLGRKGEKQQLWAGGWNEHGNLGLGDERDRDRLVMVESPTQARMLGLWGGCASTWVWIDKSLA
ncbi:hypothetical protein IAR55_003807 [Kwoniella newhampshirensis]|uniref:Secretion-regulating guanine nucleotide exchange factor n=1 Tax=Kwoniella newhampshirensis TaxID=1651941 RepID=A0AAW0YYF7_9TREE